MNVKVYETIRDVLNKYRTCNQNEIDYESAKIILKNNENCILLDVRSPQEYKEEHLEGSINIPLYDVSKEIRNIVPNNKTPIIVYCQTGNRSKNAVKILLKDGYENVYNIDGGMDNM